MLKLVIIFIILNPILSWNPSKYYADPRVHIFGNHGFLGTLHANLAPLMTNLLDRTAYDGRNIREEIISSFPKNYTVLDLCCGVGFSTPSLDNAIGVDTSLPMLKKAKKLFPNKKFLFGNAETFKPINNVDITTCFFSFHEMPQFARKNIINNAIKFTNKELIIVDIAWDYCPSKHMLYTEPYLNDYLSNIQDDLKDFEYYILKDKRVNLWKLKI